MHNESLTIDLDIEEAIKNGSLTVYYQPIFDIGPEIPVLVEVEALIRWNHPKLGILTPTDFDFWLTSDEIMTQLTDYVLQRIAEQQVIWSKQDIKLQIAINLPVFILNDSGFPKRLANFIDQYDLDHASLILELAETSSGVFSETEIQLMESLKQDGFHIVLDDFGKNPIILGDLLRLSLTGLKIDAGLINGLADNKAAQRLVRGIISLAHEMGYMTYAKNVETRGDLCALKALGCKKAQGWYFGKAMPSSKVARLLTKPVVTKPQEEAAGV